MRPGAFRSARAAFAALALVAAVGCGFGEGETSTGEATLTVTRDYGAEVLTEAAAEDPPASETVLRLLDEETEVETRYGGGFVQSIDGLAGGTEGGRRSDWFFYVNGAESPVGAAEVELVAGDRIWWDHHDWTSVMRVPAVVGSWPQPFAKRGADVACLSDEEVCSDVRASVGEVAGDDAQDRAPRVLVGPWEAIREERPAANLAGSPARSGVFARFERDELILYDQELGERSHLGDGAGIAAALEGPEPETPVWVVTGTDAAGVVAAAELLDTAALENRFAVATSGDGEVIPLPAR